MFPRLSKDIKRYWKEHGAERKMAYFLFSQEIWATIIYRFGYWVHHSIKIPVIKIVFKIIAFIAFKVTETLTGITIPFSAEIGEGLYIGHFGRIIINGKVKIGKYCTIGPQVVIGARGLGKKGVPIIGNNVFIGVGAKILGNIKIGNNVRIGANAVVIRDVPDDATVIGIAAKVVKIKNHRLNTKDQNVYIG